jgi:predicted transcriptional regulator/AraC-like DNA-binding protein
MYAKFSVFADRSKKSTRAEQSARRIEREFLRLLDSRPFQQLTVSDLADACGLARSTVYRRWAGLEGLLWNVIRPVIERAFAEAMTGNAGAAASSFARLWDMPGVLAALRNPSAARLARDNMATIFSAAIARRTSGRDVRTCALLLASSLLAFFAEFGDAAPEREKLEELVYLLYVSAHMTPRALKASARERTSGQGRFPPAVSVEESLASEDYIVSMIDGRPYRSLARHIARFGFTPEDYRSCFGLPDDYPLVAPSYSARRSELARSANFGRRARADARPAA